MPPDSTLPTDLITPKDAARLLKTHVATIYRWIMSGKLPAWSRGSTRHLIRQADLEALVKPLVPRVPPPPLVLSQRERERRQAEARERLRAAGFKV